MELQRPRVQSAIVRAARRPVTLLVAPARSGKTVALRHLLESIAGETLWFEVRPAHSSLTRFVRGLATMLETRLPKVLQSLAIAHERAMQSARPSDVLAGWLTEHLRDASRTIVIDNYHHCENDPAIGAFIAAVIGQTRPHTRWIVATRSSAELPLATWLSRGDAHVPIGEKTLRLDLAEAESLAASIAPSLPARDARLLLDATGGSIGELTFALETIAADRTVTARVLDRGGSTYEHVVDEVLALLRPDERRFVEQTADFPDLDEALLSAAGFSDVARRLAALRAKIPQAFEQHHATGRLRYAPLFGELLKNRVSARGIDAVYEAHIRTARALAGCGRFIEAFAYYIEGRDFAAIAQLVEERGLAFVEAGYGDAIHEAVEVLDPIMRTGSPVILAIKATFESRLGRFDPAESWFQLALERDMDPRVRDQIAYHYGTHLLRFQRPEAVTLLEALVADPAACAEIHCYARSALGPAYVFEQRFDDASAAAEEALLLVQESDNSHLRARVYHQAAYVAFYRNDGTRSKALAAQALEIAQTHGFFDVAAAALSVLYNVAADLEDEPAQSLRLLDAVADCAAKSGSLTSHILALGAKLEIEVECGDEQAIDELDEKLRAIDVRCCGRAIYEALLPSQALRASWAGDYAGAYHLLASSAKQQWSADRQALRWAEVAVFGAAANLRVEAVMAIRSALELLESLEGSPRITRARLFLALAMVLLGRTESALEMFTLVDAEPEFLSARLLALRRALDALCSRYRGARNHSALLGLFEALEQQHFGGLARMIMTCPLADNASLRVGELSPTERRFLAQLAHEESFVSKRRVEEIAAKLDCVDGPAVMHAVARFPLGIEPPTTTRSLQEA